MADDKSFANSEYYLGKPPQTNGGIPFVFYNDGNWADMTTQLVAKFPRHLAYLEVFHRPLFHEYLSQLKVMLETPDAVIYEHPVQPVLVIRDVQFERQQDDNLQDVGEDDRDLKYRITFLYEDMTQFAEVCREIDFDKYLYREEKVEGHTVTRVSQYIKGGMGPVDSVTHILDRTEITEETIIDLYPGLDPRKLIDRFWESDETILFLHGSWGTGKTHMARFMMVHMEYDDGSTPNIAYCDDRDLLLKDQFWSSCEHCAVLVLDDVDEEIRLCGSEKSSELSNRLRRQSNGFLTTEQKIIITTNCEFSEIDPALLRSGRCFDFIELHRMTGRDAWTLWEKLELDPHAFTRMFGTDPERVSQAQFISAMKQLDISEDRDYWCPPKSYTIETKLDELRERESKKSMRF